MDHFKYVVMLSDRQLTLCGQKIQLIKQHVRLLVLQFLITLDLKLQQH